MNGPGQPPPPGTPQWGSPPPPTGGGRTVLVVVISTLVAVLAIGAVVVGWVVIRSDGDDARVTSTSRDESTGPEPGPSLPSDTTADPVSTPLPLPTGSTPTVPASTPPTVPATVPLATVPVVPPPTIAEVDPATVLQANPLYSVAPLQAAGCAAASSVPLDTVDNVRLYYSSVLPCLDATWQQIGNGTGIAARAPSLVVFTGPSTGSCLDGIQFSFYCPSNETIYMYADEMIGPWLEFPNDYSHGISRLAATHTIAHEYGHHIQQYTGILPTVGPDFPGTESERRLELQASCLGNVFMSSQSDAYPIAAEYLDVQDLWRFITRVPNHGSEANQAVWTQRGYQGANPGDCNTFTASPPDVS